MQIIYTESYTRRASKFIKKHNNLKEQYRKTLKLLELNPNHPSLRLHKLKLKHTNVYSVSINMSYRIIFLLKPKQSIIVPIDVGPHEAVY